MIEKIRSRPIGFSIISTLVLSVFLGGAALFIQGQHEQPNTQATLMFSAVNIILTVFAIVLLGLINQTNGFKFVFKAKGFGKGLLALLPVAAFFVFNLMINARGISDIEGTLIENLGIFSVITFEQMISSFVQNVVLRGLLIVALFIKFSDTERRRVQSILKASLLYLAFYIPLRIFIDDGVGAMQLVNTFVVNTGFCAAYMYSRNLLSLVFVKGLWLTFESVINSIGTSDYPLFTLPTFAFLAIWAIILISIIIFAIKFSKRAEPFSCSG